VPASTQGGDSVAAILGEECFKLVGEAYFHGMMDGGNEVC
jgi:hypothetical protein